MHNEFAPTNGHQFEAQAPSPQQLPYNAVALPYLQDGSVNPAFSVAGDAGPAPAMYQTPPPPPHSSFPAPVMALHDNFTLPPAGHGGHAAFLMQQQPQQQPRGPGRPRTRAPSDPSNKRGRGRPRGSKDSYPRLAKGEKAKLELVERKAEVSRRKKKRAEEELGHQAQVPPSSASGSSLGPQGPFGPSPPGSFGVAGPPMTWSG